MDDTMETTEVEQILQAAIDEILPLNPMVASSLYVIMAEHVLGNDFELNMVLTNRASKAKHLLELELAKRGER
jgi:hypothetical protein